MKKIKVKKILLIFISVICILLFAGVTINLGNYSGKGYVINYFQGLKYIAEKRYEEEFVKYTINNYDSTLPFYKYEDRIKSIVIDSLVVERNIKFEERSGWFGFYYRSYDARSLLLLQLTYEDSILRKTIGNNYYNINQDDFLYEECKYKVSIEYDFDSFVEKTVINAYIDFSEYKLTKFEILDNNKIYIEGKLENNVMISVPCITHSITLYTPTFSFYIYGDNYNSYIPQEMEITFKCNGIGREKVVVTFPREVN